MNRLTVPSAVCAAALALLVGCSSEESPEAAPAASAASAAPSSAPVIEPSASAPAAPAAKKGKNAVLCEKVNAAKAALNGELRRVASPDGTVPPAEGKKVMAGLAATLTDLAGSGDGELAKALDTLAAEATKAAGAANPMEAAVSPSFDAAGQKVDSVCAKG